ncbi:hypothetical protein C2845_PM01G39820 [Panicum miliaceum]|uniref:Retrotransposon protein, putative, unclassified n=1 Tax=Panicum miliaceum TaxID=4540 RepID=A0A3L6THT4_PANMI|nr:hypothetical protein C2845_PM01G39820 [Panicum miliaceum]
MASNSGVFFSVQVPLQIQAAADHSVIFGSFPEMSAPRSSLPSSCVSETESLQGSRSDLILSSSVLHQVEHMSIQDEAQNPSRTTCRPRINIDDILAGLDRVDASLAECIGLAESALRRPRGLVPQAQFGLRSSSSVYSDQIRSSMEKLLLSDQSQPNVDQIGSGMVSGPQAGYQEILFTLPPNLVSSPDQREISVVSSEEASVEGKDEEAKRQRLHRNQNRQERCNNKAVIDQAEEDLRNADGHNPWVPPRRTPATPRNLDDDFILECDGQNLFATASANLAAAFEAPINLDDDIIGDLDGFSAFSNRLRGVSWPSTFKPVGIDKFDGDSDTKTWLRTYNIAVRAASGNNDIMAAYFPQGLHNIEFWRKMFESNPKTVSEMMVVVNKHADMEDAEKAHRHHKDWRHSDDRPKQRHDDRQRPDGRPRRHNSGKHNDRPESSKQQECKRDPDNTVAVADQPRQRTSVNQEELDRLLDGKCSWHKESNHTARECHTFRNSVAQDDPKRPRYDDRDKPDSSKTSRGRGCWNDLPRRDRDNQGDKSSANFQEANRAVNFIYGGSRAPRCLMTSSLHNGQGHIAGSAS